MMMDVGYIVKADEPDAWDCTWSVYDTRSGQPAVLDGIAQTDLDLDAATDACQRLLHCEYGPFLAEDDALNAGDDCY